MSITTDERLAEYAHREQMLGESVQGLMAELKLARARATAAESQVAALQKQVEELRANQERLITKGTALCYAVQFLKQNTVENAGNLTNPFAYHSQPKWEEFKQRWEDALATAPTCPLSQRE